jgi:hypothetical protein
MSNKRFLQAGFDNQLAHVIEECGEVLAAAGKTQRFGAFSMNPLLSPGDPLYRETNIVWLKREMIDLQEAIARLQATIEEEGF